MFLFGIEQGTSRIQTRSVIPTPITSVYMYSDNIPPILVAARSKAWVCGRLLFGMRVRIPQGAWMYVSCECCVLWGRGLCDWLITRPEEPYLVCVCHWVRSVATITLFIYNELVEEVRIRKTDNTPELCLNNELHSRAGYRTPWLKFLSLCLRFIDENWLIAPNMSRFST
jgi:hypothetical protein